MPYKAQRGVQTQASHKEQQQRDDAGHTSQQPGVVRGRGGRVHGPIIAAVSAIQAVDSQELTRDFR